jgi:2-oxoglutarate ferredoxin oxidoreductase subunit beta
LRRLLPSIVVLPKPPSARLDHATSDKGSKAKKGAENKDSAIDLVMLALQLGATYVGRSFSGDKTQLVPLIKGALSHKGTAILDVISPCVAFNNHVGSTKSFDYVREHNEAVNRMDVITPRAPITAEYAPGEVKEVRQHDGSILRLRKIEDDYDNTRRNAALAYLGRKAQEGEIVTGLLYVDPDASDLHDALDTTDTPLNKLTDHDLVPPVSALEKINAALR